MKFYSLLTILLIFNICLAKPQQTDQNRQILYSRLQNDSKILSFQLQKDPFSKSLLIRRIMDIDRKELAKDMNVSHYNYISHANKSFTETINRFKEIFQIPKQIQGLFSSKLPMIKNETSKNWLQFEFFFNNKHKQSQYLLIFAVNDHKNQYSNFTVANITRQFKVPFDISKVSIYNQTTKQTKGSNKKSRFNNHASQDKLRDFEVNLHEKYGHFDGNSTVIKKEKKKGIFERFSNAVKTLFSFKKKDKSSLRKQYNDENFTEYENNLVDFDDDNFSEYGGYNNDQFQINFTEQYENNANFSDYNEYDDNDFESNFTDLYESNANFSDYDGYNDSDFENNFTQYYESNANISDNGNLDFEGNFTDYDENGDADFEDADVIDDDLNLKEMYKSANVEEDDFNYNDEGENSNSEWNDDINDIAGDPENGDMEDTDGQAWNEQGDLPEYNDYDTQDQGEDYNYSDQPSSDWDHIWEAETTEERENNDPTLNFESNFTDSSNKTFIQEKFSNFTNSKNNRNQESKNFTHKNKDITSNYNETIFRNKGSNFTNSRKNFTHSVSNFTHSGRNFTNNQGNFTNQGRNFTTQRMNFTSSGNRFGSGKNFTSQQSVNINMRNHQYEKRKLLKNLNFQKIKEFSIVNRKGISSKELNTLLNYLRFVIYEELTQQ